jgi:YD repeat-containing protein
MSKSIAIALAIVLAAVVVKADVGGNNPTGITGQFNGNVTTGCSYDPFTANATRSITDIVVAGGVGTYPLAFTRTMNSRYVAGMPNEFGPAGNWRHSYQWSIDSVTVTKRGSIGLPTYYNVNYPDGRRVNFSARSGTDPKFRGPAGVRDRFDQLHASQTECYLWLPDGGKIWFHTQITDVPSGSGSNAKHTTTYQYFFKGIIDPYNQTTNITYPVDPVTNTQTMLITEHAGRWLQLFYHRATVAEGNSSDTVLSKVRASDGREVQYYYTAFQTQNSRYTTLARVAYFGDPSLDATYAYQPGNTDANDRPLIKTCVDPMYDGPMWRIAYSFVPGGTGVMGGQLQSEKYFDGTNIGPAVSTLTVTGTTTRTETRGDTVARTFTYTGYKLTRASDFKGANEVTGYDANSYVNSIRDRNVNTTTYGRNAFNGNVTSTTYPIPGDVQPSNTATRIVSKYGGQDAADPNNRTANRPYYLASIENGEGRASQTFYRDTSMRVTSIVYVAPSQGAAIPSESFSYDNQFGQLLTHVTRRGFTESYEYDPNNNGRVLAYRDAAHATTATPTARYQYDPRGRVAGITDARGSSNGDPSYTTTFLYNERGQLTRLTHPGGSYIQYAYNINGTLAWTADERHPGAVSDATQRTTYTYDDYKRLRTVTTPVRGQGDNSLYTTIYFYGPNGAATDYTRTDATPTKIESPGHKITTMAYDENRRTTDVTAAGDVMCHRRKRLTPTTAWAMSGR